MNTIISRHFAGSSIREINGGEHLQEFCSKKVPCNNKQFKCPKVIMHIFILLLVNSSSPFLSFYSFVDIIFVIIVFFVDEMFKNCVDIFSFSGIFIYRQLHEAVRLISGGVGDNGNKLTDNKLYK